MEVLHLELNFPTQAQGLHRDGKKLVMKVVATNRYAILLKDTDGGNMVVLPFVIRFKCKNVELENI